MLSKWGLETWASLSVAYTESGASGDGRRFSFAAAIYLLPLPFCGCVPRAGQVSAAAAAAAVYRGTVPPFGHIAGTARYCLRLKRSHTIYPAKQPCNHWPYGFRKNAQWMPQIVIREVAACQPTFTKRTDRTREQKSYVILSRMTWFSDATVIRYYPLYGWLAGSPQWTRYE